MSILIETHGIGTLRKSGFRLLDASFGSLVPVARRAGVRQRLAANTVGNALCPLFPDGRPLIANNCADLGARTASAPYVNEKSPTFQDRVQASLDVLQNNLWSWQSRRVQELNRRKAPAKVPSAGTAMQVETSYVLSARKEGMPPSSDMKDSSDKPEVYRVLPESTPSRGASSAEGDEAGAANQFDLGTTTG